MKDRRIDGILERAPVSERARLAWTLTGLEAPIVPFRRHLLDLLASNPWAVVSPIVRELYEDAVPRATDALVRKELEAELGEPREEETYWQTGKGDLEEEEDEDEEMA